MQDEEKYPGWEYQLLFNHMSEVHDLSLTKDEMDQLLSVAAQTIVLIDGVESLTK